MAIKKVSKIWMNGKWVAWDDAKIHVLSHVAHYASSVFEGIRCYDTPRGPAIFRLEERIALMFLSAKVYRMELPLRAEQIRDVCLEVVAINDLRRMLSAAADLSRLPRISASKSVRGARSRSPSPHSLRACIWVEDAEPGRTGQGQFSVVAFRTNTLPAMATASANYMNSQLMKMEALVDNYSEAIALDINGFVSEGSGQNVFAVIKGEVVTPPLSNSILAGITRDSVIVLARELGYTVREDVMPRELLYGADELFYSGTAVEISPISSVDRITIGKGERGPVTKALQDAFFGIVRGTQPDRHGWLTHVPQPAGVTAAPSRRA
jgi:branched-chain amino acid aminotransferase